MPDMIAVLDGLSLLNVSGSGGANRSGGSDFYPGAPVYPSSEGLALAIAFGDDPAAAAAAATMSPAPAPAAAAAARTLPTSPSLDTGSNGQGIWDAYLDDGIEQGWEGSQKPMDRSWDDYSGYLAAVEGSSFTATREQRNVNVSGSGGANYSGGADYYPGAPVYQSSEGLAGGRVFGGYEITRTRNVSGSGGANYSGGSDFFPGAPVYPSSEGLAAVRGGWMPRPGGSLSRFPNALAGRTALHMALAAGLSPAEAVAQARQVVATQVDTRQTPCGQAFQAAYASARRQGYDEQWSNAAASRLMSRCQAVGWDQFATKG